MEGTVIVKFDFDVPPARTLTGFTLKLLVTRLGGDEVDDDNVTDPLNP